MLLFQTKTMKYEGYFKLNLEKFLSPFKKSYKYKNKWRKSESIHLPLSRNSHFSLCPEIATYVAALDMHFFSLLGGEGRRTEHMPHLLKGCSSSCSPDIVPEAAGTIPFSGVVNLCTIPIAAGGFTATICPLSMQFFGLGSIAP